MTRAGARAAGKKTAGRLVLADGASSRDRPGRPHRGLPEGEPRGVSIPVRSVPGACLLDCAAHPGQRRRGQGRHPAGVPGGLAAPGPLRLGGRVRSLGLPGGRQRLPQRAPPPGAVRGRLGGRAHRRWPSGGRGPGPAGPAGGRAAVPQAPGPPGAPHIEGLSYDEIAEVLGCTMGTVASRLSRAHQALARVLSSSPAGAAHREEP